MQTIATIFLTWVLYTLYLVATVVVLLYIYVNRKHQYWKKKGVPHEKPTPFIGSFMNVFLGKTNLGKYLQDSYETFNGPYYGIYVLDKPYLVLRSPELIKRILITDFDVFRNKNFGTNLKADSLTANSLFMLKDKEWKSLRNKLTPIFTPSSIKVMFEHMVECGKDLNAYANLNVGKILDVKEVFSLFTIDLISSCAFGLKTNSFINPNTDLHIARRRFFNITISRGIQMFAYFFAPTLVKYFGFKLIDDTNTKIYRSMFKETFDSRIKFNVKRNDLVDLLLDIQKEADKNGDTTFDYERMVAQAVMIFSAGFETTSSSISFTAYELAVNPDIQNKVRVEIQKALVKHNNKVTFDALQELKFTDQVIAETLRKYPLVPFINREVMSKYLFEETGLEIDTNVTILIPTQGLHFDPNYFPQPEIFDPERFNDQNKILQGTYLPFGDGQRYCIGKRLSTVMMKVGLVYLLKDYEIIKCQNTPDPIEFDPKSPLLSPRRNLLVKFMKMKQPSA